MAKYASGTKSKAISDISGFEVRYTQLRTTWDNLRVEPEEFDPKQPQLTPAKNVTDATALFNPRPNNDPENVTINIGFTQDIFASRIRRAQTGSGVSSLGSIGTVSFVIEEAQTGVAGTGAIGTVGAGLVVTGNAGTFAIGSFVPQDQTDVNASKVTGTGVIGDALAGVGVSKVTGTGAIGSSTFTFDRIFTLPNGGSVGTSGIGSSVPQTDVISTNIAGTGGVGAEIPQSDVIGTGVAGTGNIGTFGEEGNGQLNLTINGIGAQGTANAGNEVAENNVIESNETGFGENYFGYATWGGDNEIRGTSGVGIVSLDIFVGPILTSGVQITGAVGTVIFSQDITFTTGWGENGWNVNEFGGTDVSMGVVGTGGVGSISFDSDAQVTGNAGTFAIGNEVVTINGGYGEGTYGSQTWGN